VRSDLTETFKIMNGECDLNCDLFFSLKKVIEEDITRNCSREDSDLILKSMLFISVIDNWNSLSTGCINCNTINTFKKHLSPELELGAVEFYS